MAARMGVRQPCLVVVPDFLEVWITTLSSVSCACVLGRRKGGCRGGQRMRSRWGRVIMDANV